jgi:hypothetical protein
VRVFGCDGFCYVCGFFGSFEETSARARFKSRGEEEKNKALQSNVVCVSSETLLSAPELRRLGFKVPLKAGGFAHFCSSPPPLAFSHPAILVVRSWSCRIASTPHKQLASSVSLPT